MFDHPQNKIKLLTQELIPIKEERNKLNEDAKKWAEKRDTFNQKYRSLRNEALLIKEKRDTINNQVQELKKIRDQINDQCKEKRSQISELKEKFRELNENTINGNLKKVSRQIEEIDWKIQTNPLPIKEEQKLISQIRQLEKQLIAQKRIKKVKDELYKLQNEKTSLDDEAKIIHKRLSELAEQSQEFHTQMIEILNRAADLRTEADKAHQRNMKIKQEAQKKHQKCTEVIEQIKTIEKILKEIEEKKLNERQDELQRELEEQALEKLKSGKKLLWEEFQILAKKGLV